MTTPPESNLRTAKEIAAATCSATAAPKRADPIDQVETIQSEEVRIQAEAAARIQALQEQRATLNAARRPLHVAIERHRKYLGAIARAEATRLGHLEMDRSLCVLIDAHLWHDSAGLIPHQIFENDPARLNARRCVEEIDRWLSARRAELPEIEKEIWRLADALKLEHLVPAGVSRPAS